MNSWWALSGRRERQVEEGTTADMKKGDGARETRERVELLRENTEE